MPICLNKNKDDTVYDTTCPAHVKMNLNQLSFSVTAEEYAMKIFFRILLPPVLCVCIFASLAVKAEELSYTNSISEHNYRLLQQEIPIYEEAVAHPWATLPTNLRLKPGKKNIAVLTLRGRLRATYDLTAEMDKGLVVYDAEVVQAVKHFQSRHGLKPDGIVGPATLYELNVPPEQRLLQIQINMDRWAKLSAELNNRYIMINIPAFQMDLVENGQKVLSMKAIVGKPERPTPQLTSMVTRLVLNPYWNVPKLIAEKDIIPKVQQNPNYLDDMGIRIFDRQDNDSEELQADAIDWDAAQDEGFQYHFRQDPGTQNALGLIKFEFRNSDDIYMHDTPAKNLFDLDKRAYSSGCIRLERPFDLAAYLMKNTPEWTTDAIQDILDSGKTRYVNVSNPTKVIITYITSWVDDNGNLQFRDDLYGLDEINRVY